MCVFCFVSLNVKVVNNFTENKIKIIKMATTTEALKPTVLIRILKGFYIYQKHLIRLTLSVCLNIDIHYYKCAITSGTVLYRLPLLLT